MSVLVEYIRVSGKLALKYTAASCELWRGLHRLLLS